MKHIKPTIVKFVFPIMAFAMSVHAATEEKSSEYIEPSATSSVLNEFRLEGFLTELSELQRQKPESLRTFEKFERNISSIRELFNQPVHSAESNQALQYLLNKGFFMSLEFSYYISFSSARTDLARLFIKHGADVNYERSEYGEEITVLQAVAANGDDELLTYVLSKGAKPDHKNKSGTALTYALRHAKRKHREHEALSSNKKAIIKRLLSVTNDPEGENSTGKTAIMHAAEIREDWIVTTLIEKGADPYRRKHGGLNSGACAADYFNKAFMEKLLRKKDEKLPVLSATQSTLCVALLTHVDLLTESDSPKAADTTASESHNEESNPTALEGIIMDIKDLDILP